MSLPRKRKNDTKRKKRKSKSKPKSSVSARKKKEQLAKSQVRKLGKEQGKELAEEGGSYDMFQETFPQYSEWSNDILPSFRELAGYEDPSGMGTYGHAPDDAAYWLLGELVEEYWEGVYEGYQETGGRLLELSEEHEIPFSVLKAVEYEAGNEIESIREDIMSSGFVSPKGYFIQIGKGQYPEEWVVFESENEAFRFAKEYVRQDLYEDPSMFNDDWLRRQFNEDAFIEYMRPSIADRVSQMVDYEPEFFIEHYDVTIEDINAWLGKPHEDGDASKMDEAYDDYIEKELELIRCGESIDCSGDAYDYYTGYFDMSNIIDFIDVDDAAEDAVNTDGIAHFLAPYDHTQIDLVDDWVAYRRN